MGCGPVCRTVRGVPACPPLLAVLDPWWIAILAAAGLWIAISCWVQWGALRAARLGRMAAPACFRAAPGGSPEDVHIAFLGDLQRGVLDVPRTLARVLAETKADLLVSSGDFASHGEGPYYGIALAAFARAGIKTPARVVPGNHDLWPSRNRDDRIGGAEFERVFGARHWALRAGPVLIVGLDDGAPYLVDDQLPWLESTLAEHPGVPWICVCHELPFDLGSPDHAHLPHLDAFAAALRRLKPALVVTGHMHSYHDEVVHGVRCIVNAHGGDVHGLALRREDFELLHVHGRGGELEVERKAYPRQRDGATALDQLAVRFWSGRRKPWGHVLGWPMGALLKLLGRDVPIVRHAVERHVPERDVLVARRREPRP